MGGADRDQSAQPAVIMAARERWLMRLLSQSAQGRDEDIFEGRLVNANLFDSQPGGAQSPFQNASRFLRVANEKVKAVAESLCVDDLFFVSPADLSKDSFGFTEI